jgi:hypothetical protein
VLKEVINLAFIATFLYALYSAATGICGDAMHIQGNNNIMININQPRMLSEYIAAILDESLVDKESENQALVELPVNAK